MLSYKIYIVYQHAYSLEGFSPLGVTGPPKGEETALPTTLSGLGSADGSCPRSLLDLRGWGVLWGRGFMEAILVQTTVVECEKNTFLALSVMRPSDE